jgi:outer membrane protein TolC
MYQSIHWKIPLILLIFLSLSARSEDRTEIRRISFEEALQLTLRNNYLIKQSVHQLQQMEQERKSTKGLYFPKISLHAGYNLMEDKIHFDLSPVRDAVTPLYQSLGNYGVFSGIPNPDPATSGTIPILPENISTQVMRKKMLDGMNSVASANWDLTIQERQFATLSAGFLWPIFTGGKIHAANRASQIKYEAVTIENIQKSYELTNELIERYFGKALAEEALNVRAEVKSTMEHHYRDAEKLQKEGQIAKVELLNAKLYCAEAEREWQKSVRQNEQLNDALLNTLATEGSYQVQPTTHLFYLDSLENIDFFYRMALEKSPLLAQVAKKKELVNEGYKAEKSGQFPTIAISGMYDLASKDLSPYLPGYMVGIGMKWNLFEGLSQNNKIKALSYQKLQVEDYYQKSSSDIHTAIHKYYQETGMYREQLQMLDAAMELALEYYRVRNKAFGEGMATTAQVADASLLLAKTKIDKLQAMYGYDVSLSKLLYYAGITDRYIQYMAKMESGIPSN